MVGYKLYMLGKPSSIPAEWLNPELSKHDPLNGGNDHVVYLKK